MSSAHEMKLLEDNIFGSERQTGSKKASFPLLLRMLMNCAQGSILSCLKRDQALFYCLGSVSVRAGCSSSIIAALPSFRRFLRFRDTSAHPFCRNKAIEISAPLSAPASVQCPGTRPGYRRTSRSRRRLPAPASWSRHRKGSGHSRRPAPPSWHLLPRLC